jgi:hypothetical protein
LLAQRHCFHTQGKDAGIEYTKLPRSHFSKSNKNTKVSIYPYNWRNYKIATEARLLLGNSANTEPIGKIVA